MTGQKNLFCLVLLFSTLSFPAFASCPGTAVGNMVAGSFDIWDCANEPVRIGLNNSEMLRITTTGSVGIGTTTPANALDIGSSGGLHITSGVPSSTNAALYNNGGALSWNGAALTAFTSTGTANYLAKWTATSTLGSSLLYDTTTGIGIGTTTPAATEEINGDLKIGTSSRTCDSGHLGLMQYTASGFQGCTSSGWVLFAAPLANCTKTITSSLSETLAYNVNSLTYTMYGGGGGGGDSGDGSGGSGGGGGSSAILVGGLLQAVASGGSGGAPVGSGNSSGTAGSLVTGSLSSLSSGQTLAIYVGGGGGGGWQCH